MFFLIPHTPFFYLNNNRKKNREIGRREGTEGRAGQEKERTEKKEEKKKKKKKSRQ
jgi:hypothetical protein